MAAQERMRPRSLALLKELRLAANGGEGFSLRDMADRLPCSKSTLAAIENGETPTVNALLAERIAEVVGLPLTVLFAPASSSPRARPSRTSDATKESDAA